MRKKLETGRNESGHGIVKKVGSKRVNLKNHEEFLDVCDTVYLWKCLCLTDRYL